MTDNEKLVESYSGWTEDEVARNPRVAADVIERLRTRLLDEFRRSEVPEPSAEAEFAPGECDGSGTCSASVHIHGCYTRHRADQCDAPEEYGHLPSEPQGEPSDAQVDERGRHWWACAVNAPRADWVGPCDCDLSRDPSLTEHPAALRAARVGGAQ